uniref:Structure-specific endonuclease subunit SLX1 homolog n=1 Tax=Salix viminalis TaxID=40686 RepID=A0A6N2M1X9_SALVM
MTRKRDTHKNPQELGEAEKGKDGFFACYLLTSLCPRFKGHTYIGFTVNPRRRIRQHNGELRSGACRTKKRRPWEMVFCIYGFPTNVAALQFEWAWQHPTESVAVRQAAAAFKSFSGVANKIKLAYTMLNLPSWQSLNISVNYFSTKYKVHSVGCPSLPKNMKVQICPMDELPCYCDSGDNLFEEGDNEDAWDSEEEYEKAIDGSGTVEANLAELEASSLDELPCYNGREEDIFEAGYGETEYREARNRSEPVHERSNESANTIGTVKETHADIIVQSSEDFAHSIDKTSDKQFRWFEEYGQQGEREPPSPELDHAHPFHFMNSLARKASSMNSQAREASQIATSFSKSETGDRDALTLTDEDVSELDWQKGNKLVIDKDDGASKTSENVKEIHVDAHPSVVDAHCISKASREQFERSEPHVMQDQRESPSPEPDYAEPFGFMKQPSRKASSIATTRDGGVLTLIDEDASEFDWPRWKKLSCRVINGKDQALIPRSFIPREIEVIDLLSPSPECRIRPCNKKRRVSHVYPVIIDLT